MCSKVFAALCIVVVSCVFVEVDARPPKKYATSFAKYSAEIVKSPRKGHHGHSSKFHSFEDDDDDDDDDDDSFETSHEFLRHQADFYDDKLHSEENYFPYKKTKPKPIGGSKKYLGNRGVLNTVKKKPDGSMHYITQDGDDLHAHHHFFHDSAEDGNNDDDDEDDDDDDEDDDDEEDDDKKDKKTKSKKPSTTKPGKSTTKDPKKTESNKPFIFEFDNTLGNGKKKLQSQTFKEIDDLINKAQKGFHTKNKYNFEIDLNSHKITPLNSTKSNTTNVKPTHDHYTNVFNSGFSTLSFSDPYFHKHKNYSHGVPNANNTQTDDRKPPNEHLDEFKDFFGVKHKLKTEEPRPSAAPIKGLKGSVFGGISKDTIHIAHKHKPIFDSPFKTSIVYPGTKPKFVENTHYHPTTYRPKYEGRLNVTLKPENGTRSNSSSRPLKDEVKIDKTQQIQTTHDNSTLKVVAEEGKPPTNGKPSKIATKHKHRKHHHHHPNKKQLYYRGVPVKGPRHKSKRPKNHHHRPKPVSVKHKHKPHHSRKPPPTKSAKPKPQPKPVEPMLAEDTKHTIVQEEITTTEISEEDFTEVILPTVRPSSIAPLHIKPKKVNVTYGNEVPQRTSKPKVHVKPPTHHSTLKPLYFVTPHEPQVSSTHIIHSERPKLHHSTTQTHKPLVRYEEHHRITHKPLIDYEEHHHITHKPVFEPEEPTSTIYVNSPEEEYDDEITSEDTHQYPPSTEYHPRTRKPKPLLIQKTASKMPKNHQHEYPIKTTSKPKFHFEISNNRVTPNPDSSEEFDLNGQLYHYEPFSPPSFDGEEHNDEDGEAPQRKRKCKRKKHRTPIVVHEEENYDNSEEQYFHFSKEPYYNVHEEHPYGDIKRTNYEDYRFPPELDGVGLYNDLEYSPLYAQRREDTMPEGEDTNKEYTIKILEQPRDQEKHKNPQIAQNPNEITKQSLKKQDQHKLNQIQQLFKTPQFVQKKQHRKPGQQQKQLNEVSSNSPMKKQQKQPPPNAHQTKKDFPKQIDDLFIVPRFIIKAEDDLPQIKSRIEDVPKPLLIEVDESHLSQENEIVPRQEQILQYNIHNHILMSKQKDNPS